MRFYLIAYKRRRGEITGLRDYATQDEALAERFRLEDSRVDADLELVVLGAQNKDDLVKTHARYFKSMRQLVQG